MRLRFAIGFINITTDGTCAGSIPWIDGYHGNPCHFSLVADELSKLVERPVAHKPTHLTAKTVAAISNAFKVFESECLCRARSCFDYLFGNLMVYVSYITRLFFGDSFKVSFCRLSALGLQESSESSDFTPVGFNYFTRIGVAFRVGSNLDYAEVDSENSFRLNRRRGWYVNRHVEIEDSVAKDQIGLSLNPVHPCGLISSKSDRDSLPAEKCQKGYVGQSLKAHNSLVVDHCTMQVEPAMDSLISLVGFDSFGDSTDGHLRGQAEASAKLGINNRLNPDFVGDSLFVGNIGYILASAIERLHSPKKRLVLLTCRLKFQADCLFHNTIIAENKTKINLCERRFALPPHG